MFFVRLRESLSNFPAPLARLVRELGEELEVEVEGAELGGCEKPGDEVAYRPNRKLQPDEVAALVERYRRGASMIELAEEYGAHRNTVEAHLRRAGVAKRPMVKMTEPLVERATKLYVEELWTTAQIGKELGVDASTVAKALKRAGVRMRPAVAERKDAADSSIVGCRQACVESPPETDAST
ncbi:hypothetical protein [Nocardia farcinica]|uniref:hypothetical protein n=1 Tax=Nocardia farcinica TaxID=37329 RepID=UPI001895CFD4|nr:hypothetical protein [Nocardia farcinica]MBF6271630.1 hypothetical protein [Nocardia farcinica]MCZ9328788.1 hypothetical protein [Nocardia farcinica]